MIKKKESSYYCKTIKYCNVIFSHPPKRKSEKAKTILRLLHELSISSWIE